MISRKSLIKEVERLDPTLRGLYDDNGFKTAMILLASANVGPNVKKIAKFTKISRNEVSKRGVNLRKNRVWVGSKVDCEEWFGEHGGIAFWCDNLVADGLMKRTAGKKRKG